MNRDEFQVSCLYLYTEPETLLLFVCKKGVISARDGNFFDPLRSIFWGVHWILRRGIDDIPKQCDLFEEE